MMIGKKKSKQEKKKEENNECERMIESNQSEYIRLLFYFHYLRLHNYNRAKLILFIIRV